jgi:hypothetical protein
METADIIVLGLSLPWLFATNLSLYPIYSPTFKADPIYTLGLVSSAKPTKMNENRE